MEPTKLTIMEQLDSVLTSELLEKFYVVALNSYSVSLQGRFSEVEVLDINDRLGIEGDSLKLWGVSRGGYVELSMCSDSSLFQVNGKPYALNITLTN
tara:strand:- start:2104 stop:2394 length:291 start_codon:yes stop_codon:yes gene_type:complete